MSSDEDDYMSDTFLTGCVKEDVRPGLISNYSQKRRHELLKKKIESDEINKHRYKPQGLMEKETRDVALEQPISSDNKGFKMLQKLGFKPGSGLGRSSEGCKEPVPINIKSDRQGLGRAEAIKEILNKKMAIHKEMQAKLENVGDYRRRLCEEAAEKRMSKDFRKSQKVCKQLDLEEDVEPPHYWFWPEAANEEVTPAENENEDENDEHQNYIANDDDNCDKVENDGQTDSCNVEDKEEVEEYEEDEDESNYTVLDKLEMLTMYLRLKHFYCIWCGTKYADDKDLKQECPGPMSDLH